MLARREAPSPRDAALLAVAGSLAVWLGLEVGLFATNYVEYLAERDLIAAAPPLFLVLCRWLDLGAPGRRRVLAAAAFAAVALVALIPLDTWVDPTAIPSAPELRAPRPASGPARSAGSPPRPWRRSWCSCRDGCS